MWIQRCVLGVKMRRKPIRRLLITSAMNCHLQLIQHLHERLRSQIHIVNVFSTPQHAQTTILEVGLSPQQGRDVAILEDARGPVVGNHDVDRGGIRQQLQDVEMTVVEGGDSVWTVWTVRNRFAVPLFVVERVEDPGQTTDCQPLVPNYVGTPHVVHIRRNPATVMQLSVVIRGFVVSAHIDGENGRNSLSRVIVVKVLLEIILHPLDYHEHVLLGALHAPQILLIPHRLEIAGNDEQVDLLPVALKHLAHSVEGVELSVPATRYGDVDRGHNHFLSSTSRTAKRIN